MARKRAPGGGRKPIGPSAGRPLTIRIDDDLRNELEATAAKRAKRKPKWNLSQEILHRLRWSLNREREDRRSLAMRAICYLISDMASRELRTDRWQSWHRNPFAFAAFKAAVAGLLDDLAPPGDVQPPPELAPVIDPLSGIGTLDKPEMLGGYAADKEMILLRLTSPLSKDEAAEWLRRQPHILPDDIEAFEEDVHKWAGIRRLFDIEEPEET
jgi:hypothetical protein